MSAINETSNFGDYVSTIEAIIEQMATKADIGRLEAKIDNMNECLGWQFRWLMALNLLAIAASSPDVISLLR